MKLYKIDTSGRKRVWEIITEGNKSIIKTGIVGGALREVVTEHKPTKRESASEVAIRKALAEHTRKRERELWSENVEDAPKFVAVQLAKDATKHIDKMDWETEIYGQPKLDGARGLFLPDKEGLIQSRKGTYYTLPHLYEQLSALNKLLGNDYILDGEVYLHGTPLGHIVGAARAVNDLTEHLQFHIFDIADQEGRSYSERKRILDQVSDAVIASTGLTHIKVVRSEQLHRSEVDSLHNIFVRQGFEGLMLRQGKSEYGFGKRDFTLMKYKKFKEEEFVITDIVPDKHDAQGILVMVTKEGAAFKGRSVGTDEYRRHLLQHRDLFIGKTATVRFFDYTIYNVPQFPVVVAIGQEK